MRLKFSFRAFTSIHLYCKDVRILRPLIASCSQDPGVAKPSGTKLIKEGAAFLGAGNSGEPIARVPLNLLGEWSLQYQFRSVNGAVMAEDSSQFLKNILAGGI
jgi:hypothetical protein